MPGEELVEEVESINAIHPDSLIEDGPSIYHLQVPDLPLSIKLSFPSSYPQEPPHLLSIDARGNLKGHIKIQDLNEILYSTFISDQVCIFDFCEQLREIYMDIEPIEPKGHEYEEEEKVENVDVFKDWTLSDPIIDRKSTFIGLSTKVDSVEEAQKKLERLKSDRKISRATHNMTAWRIKRSDGITFQDCDDDGETAAGGRLLHLLTIMDVWNVFVVVSRWYGGIQLGPDRFKHINSAARDALVKGNFISDNVKKSKK